MDEMWGCEKGWRKKLRDARLETRSNGSRFSFCCTEIGSHPEIKMMMIRNGLWGFHSYHERLHSSLDDKFSYCESRINMEERRNENLFHLCGNLLKDSLMDDKLLTHENRENRETVKNVIVSGLDPTKPFQFFHPHSVQFRCPKHVQQSTSNRIITKALHWRCIYK